MGSLSVSRIKRELKEIMRRDEIIQGLIKIEVLDDNFMELRGEISGPEDTPYEGGKFSLDIKVPVGYPFNPPTVRFTTRIWHPNVCYMTGSICNDILMNNWAAAMTIPSVLLSLQGLMSVPEPDEPQNIVVGFQYKEEHDMFLITAKHWTNVYAGGPFHFPECDTKIQHLVNMGVDENEARIILSKRSWDMQNTTEHLFT
ncbi:ubiquitin-conjugating enzyme E2-22 kDa-like [Drosophila innubila]|uniref:ubiquitin-conjugating enzyme E2-22 kDa-like n=1 Tax=Drosophila innubila TaxID=198719 RepID=UPI00148D10C8|nr:ubiquitin-conjugating enzyme E2-22 kDa-like [Drosophila innubila]